MQNTGICVWFPSLSSMHLRSTHAAVCAEAHSCCMATWHSAAWLGHGPRGTFMRILARLHGIWAAACEASVNSRTPARSCGSFRICPWDSLSRKLLPLGGAQGGFQHGALLKNVSGTVLAPDRRAEKDDARGRGARVANGHQGGRRLISNGRASGSRRGWCPTGRALGSPGGCWAERGQQTPWIS